MNRRTVLAGLCIAGCTASLPVFAAPAAESPLRRAWLTLNPTTLTMKMALPPGLPKNLPISIPGLDGAPKRTLQVSLWTPQSAPAGAKAEVDVPEGLKIGKTLPLAIENLNLPAETDRQFKMSYYFGCATTLPAGQPVTYNLDSLTKQVGDLKGSSASPTEKRLHELPKDAAARGGYALRSYAGNVSTEIPAELDFMEPVEVLSPQPGDPIDTSQTILVSWNKVPRAKAYLVSAVGMKAGGTGEDQSAIWMSAGDPAFGMIYRTRNPNDVTFADRVKKGWYLGPDATRCNIPAGIFKAGSPLTVTVSAIGDEKVVTHRYDEATKTNVPISPAITISPNSTTTVMVGLPGFGGLEGLDLGDDDDAEEPSEE